MKTYNSDLQNHKTELQDILDIINELPEASSGVELPELTNPATVNDILINKEAIDADGNKIIGTIPSMNGTTITPTTTKQTAVTAGTYVTGDIKVGATFEDALIEGTVTEYSNDRVTNLRTGFFTYASIVNVNLPACTNIGSYAFNMCQSLVSVSFPACVSIGSGAFNACISLTAADFPECTYIDNVAFTQCKSLTSANFPKCSFIGTSAFANCSVLATINFPVCDTMGTYAFYNCSQLTSAVFPMCGNIKNYAFTICSKLTTADFPVCTDIGNTAFQSCSALSSINFPICTDIGNFAFASCSSLTSLNFPSCTYIGGSVFYSCTSLTSISFPVCSYIGNNAFARCTSLTSVYFPACISIGYSAFSYCTSLVSASFPVCTSIGGSVFRACYNLTTLILGASTVCTLSNSNAFYSTPIGGYSTSAGKFGTIYVPTKLLSFYQAATNWTYFSSRFATMASIGLDEPEIDESNLGTSNTITFYISDGYSTDTLTAEKDMTWSEWCNSEYNTLNAYESGGSISFYNGSFCTINNISPSDTIINNQTYYTY